MISLLLATVMQTPVLAIDYKSMEGLKVSINGVPIVQGSMFQYLKPGTGESHFNSLWRQLAITRKQGDVIHALHNSADNRCGGSQTITRTPNGFKCSYEFTWRGTRSAKFESAAAFIWAPAIEAGRTSVGGVPGVDLLQPPKTDLPIAKRILGSGRTVIFDAPLARITIRSSLPNLVLYDARNYRQAWAEPLEMLWLGHLNLTMKPDETIRYVIDWTIEPKFHAIISEAPTTTKDLHAQTTASAVIPPLTRQQLIPRPKEFEVAPGPDCPADQGFSFDLPQGCEPARDEFLASFNRLWYIDRANGNGSHREVAIRAKLANLSLPDEGYEIRVHPDSVAITAQSRIGVRQALRTLVQLIRVEHQSLVVPCVRIRDWPSVKWRGVHLFVGPTLGDFQRSLFERVLTQMKFNRAVIQCERTAWDATPGIETKITAPKDDLIQHFDYLRSVDIEPIPLIQSFGHMNWLFANDKNLDLAIMKDSPHAIDPRKAKARELLTKLWDEAIAALKPKTVHFGLDEVDRRGWSDDPYLTDRLWQQHVAFLSGLAKRNGVQMMLWGDVCLTTQEAPDAAHGDGANHVAVRRAAIPKGSIIGDWHYRPSKDPAVFKSLELWKKEGQQPIATSWFRTHNIRSHTLAAIKSGAGTLQTTWAGYESSEDNMLREISQFSALIVAADYAWSGRTDMPEKLPYRADEVLRRLFYSPPSVVKFQPGQLFAAETSKGRRRVGQVEFDLFEPIQLQDVLTIDGIGRPKTVALRTSGDGRTLALALDLAHWLPDRAQVADIRVRFADGSSIVHSLTYGRQVRSARDRRSAAFSERSGDLCCVRLNLGEHRRQVTGIEVTSLTPYAGLKLAGVTLF